jgi:hypothetical protein
LSTGVWSGEEYVGHVGRGFVAVAVADIATDIILAMLADLPVGDDSGSYVLMTGNTFLGRED